MWIRGDLSVQRLHPDAVPLRRANPWDAGLDLATVERIVLEPGARGVAPTGWAIAVPPGWAGLVLPRSGVAARDGVTLTNSPGLVDAGYRGELRVLLINHGDRAVTLEPGDRVAQLVLTPIWDGQPTDVAELPAGDGRGAGGFGSTGLGT